MPPSPPATPWQIPAVAYLEHHHVGGSYIHVGPQMGRLLGWPRPQVGSPGFWKQLLHPDDRDRVLAEDEQVELTGQPWANTYRVATRDGRFVSLRDEAVLVTDSAGEPRFWQGVLFDITSYQDMQTQAAERLYALDEAKSAFLTALNHQLRTPLATILGVTLTLQQLGRRLNQEDISDLLARLGDNARKLEQMVSDLLAVNPVHRRVIPPVDRRPVDVPTLVEQAAAQWRVQHRRTLEVDADPIVAHLDAAKTRRILEALLANAAQHTPPDAPVWVRVRRRGRDVLLTVEDAGPGVPAELRDAVFESFQRGSGAPAHAPGLGIGLAVVRRLAELHGGHAWVQERAGGGACFHVLLPASPRDSS